MNNTEELEKMKKSRHCKINIITSAMSTIHTDSGFKPFERQNELKSSLLQKINLVQDDPQFWEDDPQFWEKTYKKNIIEDLLNNLDIPIQLKERIKR